MLEEIYFLNTMVKIINNLKMNPKLITPVLLCTYLVLSLSYIGYDLWNDFKVSILQKAQIAAYQQAQADDVAKLMQEAEKCLPFEIFAGEKKLQLINTACDATTKES